MILPPKVSSAERTRAELELLHGEVDARLSAFQARPGAVCAVREQVFSDLYDEVIREVSSREMIFSMVKTHARGLPLWTEMQ